MFVFGTSEKFPQKMPPAFCFSVVLLTLSSPYLSKTDFPNLWLFYTRKDSVEFMIF
jgi:hypothetical protein